MRQGEDASLMATIARDRDRRAFERLYDRHHRLVYGLAWRMLGEATEADDVFQVVFLYAWEKADRFDPARGSVEAWLTVLTRSRCLDRLRQRVRRRRREMPVEADLLEALAGTPPDEGQALAQRRAVVRALEQLTPVQRAVVEEAYFQGRTQVEIARGLDLPVGTVKGRLRLALDRLAKALARGSGS